MRWCSRCGCFTGETLAYFCDACNKKWLKSNREATMRYLYENRGFKKPGMFRSWWHAARWFVTYAIIYGSIIAMLGYVYWLVI